MPWKECHVMDERLRFVARLLEGEKMAPLCAEFGISRKTGYKIFDRYKDCGVAAFTDRSRRPVSPGESAAAADRSDDRAAEAGVSRLGRAQDPREAAAAVRPARTCPAISTVHAVLDRHGLVHRRRRRRRARDGHGAVPADRAECAVVRRLQRRVHARQSAVLLSADDHRLRQSLPADVRGAARRRRRNSPSRSSSARSRSLACRRRFGPTTASRSRPRMRSTASANSPVWWLRLGHSDRAHSTRAIRNRTAATSGCISR